MATRRPIINFGWGVSEPIGGSSGVEGMRTILALVAGLALWTCNARALGLPEAYYGSTGIPCSVAPELLGLDGGLLESSDFLGAHAAADGLDSAFLLGFDNGRDDKIVIRRTGPDGVVEVALGRAGHPGFDLDHAAFTYVFCKCFKFAGLEAGDRVELDGVDIGYVARSLRIPYVNLAVARDLSDGMRKAAAEIEGLTAAGAFGAELDLVDRVGRGKSRPSWLPAVRNTVAVNVNAAAHANIRGGAKVRADSRHVIPVGGGTLVRFGDRLFVVSVAHIIPRGSGRFGLGIVASDGATFPVVPIIRGGQQTDLAVLRFLTPEAERAALEAYGGVAIRETPIDDDSFVFHLGYPGSWRDEANAASSPTPEGRTAAEGQAAARPVLTSGVVEHSAGTIVSASLRLGQGDSGGGLFALAEDGTPELIGPASTVRTRYGDGNPPDRESIGPVIGRFIRLAPFGLERVVWRYLER